MNFPSFKQIFDKSFHTAKRFPFALLCAIAGSFAAIWAVQINWESSRPDYFLPVNFAFISALGIASFLSATTLAEHLGWNSLKTYATKLAILMVLALYLMLIPDNFIDSESEAFIRYLLFFVAVHLFVSFAPFLRSDRIQDFWEYNKTLFLRFLNAGIFSAVLFAGLSIAMVSLDNLLEISIDGKRYAQLWFLLVGIFNTWFFLAGVPESHQMNDTNAEYPGILKIFVQYILIPLVTIYIIILYLYTGKILIEWEWPNGWVANLILGYSIAGIFSLLLLYPIRNDKDNRWIQLFSRGYYLALIPLIILLALSIWVRISEYGITVNRYFVVILALWLTGMVAYFLISRQKNIKLIPMSLCVIVVLISFGPLGAFEVAERSQLNRFEYYLEKNDMLDEGNPHIIPAKVEVSLEDRKQISSVIHYLENLKGVDIFQSYFEENVEKITQKADSADYKSDTEKIMQAVNLEYVSPWSRFGETENQSFYFNSQNNITNIENYDYFIEPLTFYPDKNSISYSIENVQWNFSFVREENSITIENTASTAVISADIFPLVATLFEKYQGSHIPIPGNEMTITAENEDLNVLLLFHSINGSMADSSLNQLSLSVFIEEKGEIQD